MALFSGLCYNGDRDPLPGVEVGERGEPVAGTKTEEDAKMAKLYFKYGAMGSSKSAQALITKFNYEELGMTVWLIKIGRAHV